MLLAGRLETTYRRTNRVWREPPELLLNKNYQVVRVNTKKTISVPFKDPCLFFLCRTVILSIFEFISYVTYVVVHMLLIRDYTHKSSCPSALYVLIAETQRTRLPYTPSLLLQWHISGWCLQPPALETCKPVDTPARVVYQKGKMAHGIPLCRCLQQLPLSWTDVWTPR